MLWWVCVCVAWMYLNSTTKGVTFRDFHFNRSSSSPLFLCCFVFSLRFLWDKKILNNRNNAYQRFNACIENEMDTEKKQSKFYDKKYAIYASSSSLLQAKTKKKYSFCSKFVFLALKIWPIYKPVSFLFAKRIDLKRIVYPIIYD